MDNYIQQEKKYFLQTYKRFPIVVECAKGTKIYDNQGNEYLDFLGGIAVNVLGHVHPVVLEAIEMQIK
ncbi:MAG: aminotransferase class III-fold pyridoxal phosphate-dependent enzyme, partial [Candidatus Kapaibacteriota bacterium]